ncbi:MAG: hypothetical protein ACK5EU_01265, partial [Pseudanabaena sp.]
RVVFYILAAIRLAILCGYSSVLLLVIVCLDHLSIYIPDFTHFNLHSLAFTTGLSLPHDLTDQCHFPPMTA